MYRCLFALSSVCLFVCLLCVCLHVFVHVGLHVCTNPKTDATSTNMEHPIGAKSIQNRPMDPQSGSEIDPETTKIAPKSPLGGPSGGHWGAPRILCATVAFKVPPGMSENQLFGPPRAQKGPQGPPKRLIGSTRCPRKRHLGVFCPPKATHRKKRGHFEGPLGPDVRFP